MLIVALVAILLGILCLYFEMKRFNFEIKQAPKAPAAAAAPDLAPPAVLARLEPGAFAISTRSLC
jgi:hypothetical protein